MTVQNKAVAKPAQGSIDEIDQIMNEIEELQESMATAQAMPSVAVPVLQEANAMEEFQAGSGEVSMEETLANLKDEEPSGPNLIDQAIEAEHELLNEDEVAELDQAIENAEAEAAAAVDEVIEEIEEVEEEPARMTNAPRRPRPESVTPIHGAAHSEGGSVSVNLSGNMTLHLTYEFEGQDVTIGFKDGALQVSLSDGTEFKIPVRRNSLRKSA
jgi:hypothetical protein